MVLTLESIQLICTILRFIPLPSCSPKKNSKNKDSAKSIDIKSSCCCVFNTKRTVLEPQKVVLKPRAVIEMEPESIEESSNQKKNPEKENISCFLRAYKE